MDECRKTNSQPGENWGGDIFVSREIVHFSDDLMQRGLEINFIDCYKRMIPFEVPTPTINSDIREIVKECLWRFLFVSSPKVLPCYPQEVLSLEEEFSYIKEKINCIKEYLKGEKESETFNLTSYVHVVRWIVLLVKEYFFHSERDAIWEFATSTIAIMFARNLEFIKSKGGWPALQDACSNVLALYDESRREIVNKEDQKLISMYNWLQI